MGKFPRCVECTGFEDFLDKLDMRPMGQEHSWVFRGQRKESWDLTTSLERECRRFGILGDEAFRREYNLIREFQRRLHFYEKSVPDRDRVDEWMALMQHYGAPTRLLDSTYSPYVAAYFAFENAETERVAVWAVDIGWIQNRFKSGPEFQDLRDAEEKYGNYRDAEAFRLLFLSNLDGRYVLSVNPFRLNDRLAYQQGVFLCPASLRAGFMDNLSALVDSPQEHVVWKFIIEVGTEGEHRDHALRRLHSMNINRITLFPGLVGFAESFKTGLLTLSDAHTVKEHGKDLPLEQLWQRLSESC